jgi:SAM-dependent methyltransferase
VILNASPWVRRFAPLISRGGLVLDLACGSGRHSEFIAGMGHEVLAVDQDIASIELLRNPLITPKRLNLEESDWPLKEVEFSAIVVTNYLFRPHLDELPKMLLKEGVLIYETFALGNGQFGKPSNPNFLLNPGELLAFATLHKLKVLAYEDIYVDQPKPAMVQRLCAVKGELKQHIPLQFQG